LVNCFFLGALAYADDIAIIAPTHAAMRAMLKLCDNFANDFSIIFNAKKSKCLFVSSHRMALFFSIMYYPIGEMLFIAPLVLVINLMISAALINSQFGQTWFRQSIPIT